ncbi:MAG: cupin domain-containing protein [Acidobacteria bacterium]|nr:cupin domain-containing protein [Acidobacteriota bacterium]
MSRVGSRRWMPFAFMFCVLSTTMAVPIAQSQPNVQEEYMLSGELGVTKDATEHILETGDAMYFDASVPHSYRRTGRSSCSALVFSVA